MTEVREEPFDALENTAAITFDDFVHIVEEHHRDEGPGVTPELVAEYADAVHYDVDVSAIDDRLTDDDEWVEGERLYRLDDERVSVYPPSWHETFSDLDDLVDLVEVIEEQVDEPEGTEREAVTDEGVPETKLFRVARVTAGVDEDAVEGRLERLDEEGEIAWDTMVHDPRVRLGDEPRGEE